MGGTKSNFTPATTYLPVTITGSSQSLTSYLSSNAIAPRFPATQQAFGYADVEISSIPQPGGYYYNVVNAVQRVWNGSAWTNGGGGGISGTGTVVSPSGDTTGATDGVAITNSLFKYTYCTINSRYISYRRQLIHL